MNLVKILLQPGGINFHHDRVELWTRVWKTGRASLEARDSFVDNLQEIAQVWGIPRKEAGSFRGNIDRMLSGGEALLAAWVAPPEAAWT